jgi:hypothetical protein
MPRATNVNSITAISAQVMFFLNSNLISNGNGAESWRAA